MKRKLKLKELEEETQAAESVEENVEPETSEASVDDVVAADAAETEAASEGDEPTATA